MYQGVLLNTRERHLWHAEMQLHSITIQPVHTKPFIKGGSSLTQRAPGLTASPIFWKWEWGDRVMVGASWPPPCVYVWSDMGQEQSRTEES